jgi:hypothetical protein
MKIITSKLPVPEIFLPNEIIRQIVSNISQFQYEDERQVSLHACCLLSRQWYTVAVPFLYERPNLHYGKRFEQFVSTICPSVRATTRTKALASLVRCLNMHYLLHQTSNSITMRVLSHVKEHLEVYSAPMTGFS